MDLTGKSTINTPYPEIKKKKKTAARNNKSYHTL